MNRRLASAVFPLLVGLLMTPGVSHAQRTRNVPRPGFLPIINRFSNLPPLPNRIMVRFRSGQSLVGMQSMQARVANRALPAMTVGREIPKIGLQVFQLQDPRQMETAIARLRRIPEVLYAEPARRITLFSPPNDPYYMEYDTDPNHVLFLPDDSWPYQWPLAFIQAEDAWAIWPHTFYTAATKPRNAVRVAVLDTGIDTDHPDFKNVGSNSVDSALGGQIDLANSRSIIQGEITTDPSDDFGHGTHVSGIVAAATNNGVGISSIGYSAQIMSLKVTEPGGDGDDADVVDAMIWAADHGALILNLSLGLNGGYSQALQDAVNYCWSKNVLVVAAAGNDGVDYVRRYPAACDKVLAVAATTYGSDGSGIFPNGTNSTIPPYENRASYSNAGLYVGIAAPGGDATYWQGSVDLFGLPLPELYTQVWSTTPTYDTLLVPDTTEMTFGYLNGTSMASPHVAGLAALYAGYKGFTQATPDAPRKIIRAIQRGADNVAGRADGGWTSVVGFGRINAFNTLKEQIGLFRPDNTPGCIVGQVTYEGIAVTPAAITATNKTTHRNYGASTKEDGTFRLANLPPGNYSVKSVFLGRSQTLDPVVVEAGCDTMATDFEMKSQVVVTITPHTVSVPAGTVQTFTATVTGTSSTAVIWSLVTGPGTMDASGNYTAPLTPTPATAVVRATSLFDPTAYDDAQITIPVYPTALTLTPNPVLGGLPVTGQVTLSSAPTADTIVNLSSNNPAASVPATVTVLHGATSATFSITTMAVRGNTVPVITATTGGKSKTASLTVQTLQPISVRVTPNPVTNGATATGTVTLNGNAPAGGVLVTLSSGTIAVATVPGSITIPQGSSTGTFSVTTFGGSKGTSQISATARNVTVKVTLTVQ